MKDKKSRTTCKGNETPIKRILIKKPYFYKKALRITTRLRIKTAEELVREYCADDFTCYEGYHLKREDGGLERRKKVVWAAGYGTVRYLNKCLQKVGLRLEDRRVSGQLSSLDILGEKEGNSILLNALKSLEKKAEKSGYKGCYFSAGTIADESNSQLNSRVRRKLRANAVFRADNIQRLLEEKLADSVESAVYLRQGYQTHYTEQKDQEVLEFTTP